MTFFNATVPAVVSWEVMGSHGKSWEVMGSHGKSWEVGEINTIRFIGAKPTDVNFDEHYQRLDVY